MTLSSVDDHAAIKARMEQLAQERANPPEADVPDPKPVESAMYLGWDIYAPVVL